MALSRLGLEVFDGAEVGVDCVFSGELAHEFLQCLRAL